MLKSKDRWERLVEKRITQLNANKQTRGFRCGGCMEYPEVAKLLRQQHRAVVRLVGKEILSPAVISERYEGWNQAIEAILELLARRQK